MSTLKLADANLHYEVEGQGPPVLFIQGVGVSGAGYAPQIEALAGTHTCVTFDNRGLGRSTGDVSALSVEQLAGDVVSLIAALDLGPVHLVGHSLGGVIAHCTALRAPQAVKSLALLCTFVGGQDLARPTARLIWGGMRSRVGTKGMRASGFARLVSPGAYVAERGLHATVAELERSFARPLWDAPGVSDKQLAALRAYDARDQLERLGELPTLVMSGRHDPIARPEFGRELARRIPGARFFEHEQASHALPIQQADVVNTMLLEHFAYAEALQAGRSGQARA